MHPITYKLHQAAHRAAKNIPNWGIWAASRYAKNEGVPVELLLYFMRKLK